MGKGERGGFFNIGYIFELTFGVAEVWYWRKGRIQPYCLRGERYAAVEASEVMPGMDLELLTSFIERATTSDAIRGYRQALRNSEA